MNPIHFSLVDETFDIGKSMAAHVALGCIRKDYHRKLKRTHYHDFERLAAKGDPIRTKDQDEMIQHIQDLEGHILSRCPPGLGCAESLVLILCVYLVFFKCKTHESMKAGALELSMVFLSNASKSMCPRATWASMDFQYPTSQPPTDFSGITSTNVLLNVGNTIIKRSHILCSWGPNIEFFMG